MERNQRQATNQKLLQLLRRRSLCSSRASGWRPCPDQRLVEATFRRKCWRICLPIRSCVSLWLWWSIRSYSLLQWDLLFHCFFEWVLFLNFSFKVFVDTLKISLEDLTSNGFLISPLTFSVFRFIIPFTKWLLLSCYKPPTARSKLLSEITVSVVNLVCTHILLDTIFSVNILIGSGVLVDIYDDVTSTKSIKM